jgi:hypothetical protein
MTISAPGQESNLCPTLGFRALAFRRRGVRLFCAGPALALNLDEWLHPCPERPSLIRHPESDMPFCFGDWRG